MQLLETELEKMIATKLLTKNGCDILLNNGFPVEAVPSRVYRQVDLLQYGRADIITVYKECFHNIDHTATRSSLHINIYELKMSPIQSDDIDQIFRYKTAIKEIIGDRYFDINCYIIAPSINSGHFIFNHCEIQFISFEYDINGIQFKEIENRWIRGDGKLSFGKIKLNRYND